METYHQGSKEGIPVSDAADNFPAGISTIYNKFLEAEPGDEATTKASDLIECLERWEETVQGINFTHSSRLAWKTFNCLTGRSP